MKEHYFLIEIGTDELPPKILKKLGIDFSNYIKSEFINKKIYFNKIKWFASPRHLAVTAKILGIQQKKFFYKNNHNNCCNSNYNALNNKVKIKDSLINTNKDTKSCSDNLLKNNCIQHNKNFKNLLLKLVNNALEKLIHYKMMKWSNVPIPFVRPVHTVTMLLDSCLITGRFFEINIDRIIQGHRFIKNNKIIINHAKDYPHCLSKKGYVIADYNIRKQTIKIAIQKQASKLGGVVDIKDDNFLEEITASIEWPIILFGRFNKQFLSLPAEVIIHIMKEHQQYFPVYNIIDGMLLPCFIFVTNTITDDYNKIIVGHENILKARFIDVEFFFKKDSQYRLEEYIPKLNSILFHRKLGSLRDKTFRVSELSGWIAKQIDVDFLQAERAGYLCKCDLMTDMVLEFPKLQGIIGMYYSRRDGEINEVAIAQKEHYEPQCAKDPIPTGKISCIVSIADKIDTISGIFGIKELPTSSRDPFALKRSAVGILNIIIQKKMSLNLINLINKSVKLYGSIFSNTDYIRDEIHKFMFKRLFLCYCLQGYRSDIITSVLNIKNDNIISYSAHIQAIHDFCTFRVKEYTQLRAIYKRISNILKNHDISCNSEAIQTSLLNLIEEKNLFTQILDVNKKIESLFIKKRYDLALLEISKLSLSVDNFLNKIIVMDNNSKVKINRLTLINMTKSLILKVINFSVLQK